MRLAKAINYLLLLLFFIVPIIFIPLTSELFEFNKIITLYSFTTVITGLWVIRMVLAREIIFRRTLLDIPLLLFVVSQVTSTILSIDPHTSIFGYYSRFNGGLLSTICYLLLYWATATHVRTQREKENIIFALLTSSILVATYAFAQHFGADAHVWVQDVKSRVFSTLGQPNWLASFIVAIIFLPLANILKTQNPTQGRTYRTANLLLSFLLFSTLLFTKSRSGILSFALSQVIFWIVSLRYVSFKPLFRTFAVCSLGFVILTIYFGTPWTPSLEKKIFEDKTSQITPPTADLLISESGDIRKVVWKGAMSLWKMYPLTGTGVETFAFSYPWVKPIEHNLLSEWDFTYNKAHNQYLNFAATTGTMGLASYLLFVATATIMIFTQIRNSNIESRNKFQTGMSLNIGLFSGWLSLLVTNFFGFSVVPTDLLLFLLPALSLMPQDGDTSTEKPPKAIQSVTIVIILLVCLTTLYQTYKYWTGDYNYKKATRFAKKIQTLPDAFTSIRESIRLNPNEPVYSDELASITADLALATRTNASISGNLKDIAIIASNQSINTSPYNLAFIRNRAIILNTLSEIDPKLLDEAINTLITATKLAPTDPQLYYNLGVLQGYAKQTDASITSFKKAYELKPNYQEALWGLGLALEEVKKPQEAAFYWEKLLEINPNHTLAREKLSKMKK